MHSYLHIHVTVNSSYWWTRPDGLHFLVCFGTGFLSTHSNRHVGYISVTVFLIVFRSFCLSAGFLITDISGVGWRRAMKFCRMIDLGSSRSSPLLVNFGSRVTPGQKVKNQQCIGQSLARCNKLAGQSWGPCDKLATAGSDGDRHVGIMPVQITSVLVYLLGSFCEFSLSCCKFGCLLRRRTPPKWPIGYCVLSGTVNSADSLNEQ